MKIRSKRAWAVVDKTKPEIRVENLYDDKDVTLYLNEEFVRVEISVIEK